MCQFLINMNNLSLICPFSLGDEQNHLLRLCVYAVRKVRTTINAFSSSKNPQTIIYLFALPVHGKARQCVMVFDDGVRVS